MATIVLSAAGMALGSSVGGSVLGLSAATLGRAAGAVIGRRIDEKVLGSGSAPVEVGRVDRFRLSGASEGAPVAQLYGRMRIAGHVIWASRFQESSETSGGGKGGVRQPETTTFSYTVSMAMALCRGEITRVGRVWADGTEIDPDSLNMQVYTGSEDQEPDPKMEAVEGAGAVPAYRGMAYVVFEDMPLGQFGNRIPQLSFEVFRPAAKKAPELAEDLAHLVKGVAMIPGTGEYSLATRPVFLSSEFGEQVTTNTHGVSTKTDFVSSIEALDGELPECKSVSLVVSWFGDDLRCGRCLIKPKVEQKLVDSVEMPWTVSGVSRELAETVPNAQGRPVYGGTPADASVIEAIRALNAAGKSVVFYPFILMEQMPGNALLDPYSASVGQPVLPWRGRITTEVAPGVSGTTDGTASAEAEVAAMFGTASASDFAASGEGVAYSGSDEWSMRRFILHQAHLCAAAGGVDAFCIGSEMRGLTQVRGAGGTFPAVTALRQLAADVRGILGPNCKISYAADWSEYHGYQPAGTGDKLFHLDPLWADDNVDFIGIDNYMPLSDWRDGEDHLDAGVGSIYDLDYLTQNVAGGEGYDWYYHSEEAIAAQIRTPISDGDGEPWVWRYKDIKGWWENHHHNRLGGVRQPIPTAWQPQSKPIWFTEFGCAAIDKGTNQPNKFLDPKSSESTLPRHSNGYRDDYVQMQYIRAVHRHFADPEANPVSDTYGAPMVDMMRAHVWAWDARPFPQFPALGDVWSDGANYMRGHWLNGRSTSRSLASVVAEICAVAGVTDIDTHALHGLVRGFRVEDTDTARQSIQSLMLAYGFDVIERDGLLVFRSRDGRIDMQLDPEALVFDDDAGTSFEAVRRADAEMSGRVQLSFVDAESDYDLRVAEAVLPGDAQHSVSGSELPIALAPSEGRSIAERWLVEASIARDTAQFSLPPSLSHVGVGDIVSVAGQLARYRIDRADIGMTQALELVRVEPESYLPFETADVLPKMSASSPGVPVEAVFLDLPLLTGDEVPHAPYIAVTARPWPGNVALYASSADEGYALNTQVERSAVIGTTMTDLAAARPGEWDNGGALRVRLVRGNLASVSMVRLLAGANVAVIGDGFSDHWEVFQFQEAELVAPRTYDLWIRLRGQAGTDSVMPSLWPAGSRFVLMNAAVRQIDLAGSARGVARHYRYGPARLPVSDPTYRHQERSFQGFGLRPYAVSHLRADREVSGDIAVTWIRRSRIDADSWSAAEVPLGEDSEAYLVRIAVDGVDVRRTTVNAPNWVYTAAMQAEDGVGEIRVSVAQVSSRFGDGPARSKTVS